MKQVKKSALLSAIGLLLVIMTVQLFAQGQQQKNRAQIAWDLIRQQNALVIDVRTEEEFLSGHLEKAVNIPLQTIGQKILQVYPDKERPIVLYCRSGNRSQQAFNILKNLGYKNIYNGGGYEELLAYK